MPNNSEIKIKVCNKCGGTDRASNGKCRPCVKIYREENREKLKKQMRANYEANKEKQLLAQKIARELNPEIYKARVKAWADLHPEQMSALKKRWKAANKERVCAHSQIRRAKLASAGGTFGAIEIKKLMALQKKKCPVCKVGIENNYHADHVIPLAKGGSNHIENIQLLCPTCNLQKGAKQPEAFMQSRGFLL